LIRSVCKHAVGVAGPRVHSQIGEPGQALREPVFQVGKKQLRIGPCLAGGTPFGPQDLAARQARSHQQISCVRSPCGDDRAIGERAAQKRRMIEVTVCRKRRRRGPRSAGPLPFCPYYLHVRCHSGLICIRQVLVCNAFPHRDRIAVPVVAHLRGELRLCVRVDRGRLAPICAIPARPANICELEVVCAAVVTHVQKHQFLAPARHRRARAAVHIGADIEIRLGEILLFETVRQSRTGNSLYFRGCAGTLGGRGTDNSESTQAVCGALDTGLSEGRGKSFLSFDGHKTLRARSRIIPAAAACWLHHFDDHPAFAQSRQWSGAGQHGGVRAASVIGPDCAIEDNKGLIVLLPAKRLESDF